jgi:hypothetical protein
MIRSGLRASESRARRLNGRADRRLGRNEGALIVALAGTSYPAFALPRL